LYETQLAKFRATAPEHGNHSYFCDSLAPKYEALECEVNVRFTPESGRVQCFSPCPLSANSGHRDRRYEKNGPSPVFVLRATERNQNANYEVQA